METLIRWKLAAFALLIFVILLTAYVVWVHYLKKRAFKLCGHYVHFVPPLPIIGNARTFSKVRTSADAWNLITELSNKYKKGVCMWLFHIPWILVRELDVVEAILMSSESTEKSHVYRLLDTITDGVFTAPGERWKKLRKKLNLTFGPRQLDFVYQELNELLPVTVDVLKKNTGKYINIMSFITPFFFDAVSRTHFGVATNEQRNRHMQVTEIAAKVIELTIENRVFKPFNHLMLIFKTTRVNKFIRYIGGRGEDFIKQIISQRLSDAEEEKLNGAGDDEKKRIYYVDGVKEALRDLNIEPSVFNIERNTGDMLIAGSDTTSIAVCTAFYYMAINPDIQEKVYQETIAVFGDDRTKELSKDDIARLEYTEMVVKEALRRTAPPGIIRELSKDLDVGKYIIPKGTNVYLSMKSIHENPEFYEKPNDFYPEHFSPEAVKQRPKFAFLAFSAGPRNCPGMAYSYVTMKGLVATVIRNFKLDTNIALKDIKYKMVLMQEHANGYYIKLTER